MTIQIGTVPLEEFIKNALKAASDQYTSDAAKMKDAMQLRISEQFAGQAADCLMIMEKIEKGEVQVLSREEIADPTLSMPFAIVRDGALCCPHEGCDECIEPNGAEDSDGAEGWHYLEYIQNMRTINGYNHEDGTLTIEGYYKTDGLDDGPGYISCPKGHEMRIPESVATDFI